MFLMYPVLKLEICPVACKRKQIIFKRKKKKHSEESRSYLNEYIVHSKTTISQQDALYIKKSVLEQNVLSYALKYQV